MKEFSSPKRFAAYLEGLAALGPTVMSHAAEKAGALVEMSAKAEIGAYQPQRGPFVAWASLEPCYEHWKIAHGGMDDAPLLFTGELQKSIRHTTVGDESCVGSDDQRMVYHEFGTEKMPPRPVLGPALYMNRDRILMGAAEMVYLWVCGLGWRHVSFRAIRK